MIDNTDGGLGGGVDDTHEPAAPVERQLPDAGSPNSVKDRTTIGPVIMALLVALVTLLAYLPATHNQFLLWDDNTVVYENPRLATPGFFWRHPYYQLYTPVTDTIYAIIAALFRLSAPVATPLGDTSNLSPAAFHGANVVFHAANAALVFVLIRLLLPRAGERRRDFAAAAGALVFALHPLQVEAVAWVSGANNVFCGFFTLLALILYVRAEQQESSYSPFPGGERGGGRGVGARLASFAMATVCFALALLAKPTAVTVPLAAVAIDIGILRRPIRRSAPLLLWLLMSLAITVITRGVQPPNQVIPMGPLWFRPFLMLESLAFYLMKLFAPVSPAVDYGLNPPWLRSHTAWYLYWIAPIAVGGFLWSRRHVWPVVSTAAAFSALCLLATIGLIPTYGAIGSVVADRYVYLAMFGPALIVAHILSRSRPQIAFPVALAAVAALAAVGVAQESLWADTNTVMTQTLSVNPRSWAAYMDRGIWRWTNRDVEGSIEDDRAALAQYPGYYRALTTLPVRLMYKWVTDGQPADEFNLMTEAEAMARQAIRQAPWDPTPYGQLGDIYHYLERPADAARQYEMVLELTPNDATARGKFGYCLEELRAKHAGSAPSQ